MRVLGHGDQMDVVGHEAITEDAHAGADGVVSQQVKIELAVVIGGEHGLPIVAALRDVVRHIRHHDSWTAGHMREVPDGQSVSQENASVTFSSREMRRAPWSAKPRDRRYGRAVFCFSGNSAPPRNTRRYSAAECVHEKSACMALRISFDQSAGRRYAPRASSMAASIAAGSYAS